MSGTQKTREVKKVSVEIMGRRYDVPEGITLVQAMWYTGHKIVRGIGCLGGVCGACATVYRTKESRDLKVGLGCQLLVEEGISFTLTPGYPAQKTSYRLEEITDPKQDLFKYYPEVALCRNCNACTEACPQHIDVRTGVWKAAFGDFGEVSKLFLSCVMCGLCVPVCIADIAPNQVAVYAGRVHASLQTERPPQLIARIREIEEGKFDGEWEKVMAPDAKDVKGVPAG
ncbi:MAG TPA: 4Fe-4S dicluster domain-containing protein [Nitrospiria bacterium]|nr:4Fe-4S dicluster domain-containing protein [Nitrospiria bacterium]